MYVKILFLKVLFIVFLSYQTDRSRTVTPIAQTIDISPQKAVLGTHYSAVQAKCNKNKTKTVER